MKIEWKLFMNGDFIRLNFSEDKIIAGIILYYDDMNDFKRYVNGKNAEKYFYKENVTIAKRMLKYY